MENQDPRYSQPPTDNKTGKKKGNGLRRFARGFMLSVFLIVAIIIYWFFFNRYGSGERTGVLIKITNTGNIFKTDEGELWLSCRQVTNPEKFYFSVVNDSVAVALKNLQDECVQLTYSQYRASLPWRGNTRYIVTGVIPINKN